MFLIVGGDSEIGAAAYQTLKARGAAVVATTRRSERVASDRPFLDLATPLDAWQPPATTTAACICAALPRLAACAADPAGTAYINVQQTSALIDKLAARGIYVLFLSTNQVFDGSLPHMPADAAYAPTSEYGRQKVRTETFLRERMDQGAPGAILRLAKVISARMPLFAGWAADLAAGKPIRTFGDMTLAPTPTDLVCRAIAALLHDRATGIFQLTGPRDVTYAEVGRFLAASLDAAPALVTEISAHSAGLPEGATPHHTTLDSTLLRQRYGIEVPDVWEAIEQAVAMRKNDVVSTAER